MTTLVVAALSARMLAEAARNDGFDVVALDLFGDADTRRACSQWYSIGEPGALQIDPARFTAAVDSLAAQGDVAGWIAGAGFEGRPDLLERGAARLPLIGTPPDAVRRVRDPRAFFGFLDAQVIAHPRVSSEPPENSAGWLVKDAHGCGGWHIRRASSSGPGTQTLPSSHHYFQREVAGMPMSVTFLADGRDAVVLGFNQQIVRQVGLRPFVYCGVVGPVPLAPQAATAATAAVSAIVREFGLRGLGSLDFLLDDETCLVLEVNPRPPASTALYAASAMDAASSAAMTALQAPGIVAAHVRACLQGELPPRAMANISGDTVSGTQIVFAPRSLMLDASTARDLARRPRCHDLPGAGTRFEAGDPLCSVSAGGANAEQVHVLLGRACEAVQHSLEIAS